MFFNCFSFFVVLVSVAILLVSAIFLKSKLRVLMSVNYDNDKVVSGYQKLVMLSVAFAIQILCIIVSMK